MRATFPPTKMWSMTDLGVVRKSGLALFAANARGLVAAEGDARVKLVPGIDPHRAGLESA